MGRGAYADRALGRREFLTLAGLAASSVAVAGLGSGCGVGSAAPNGALRAAFGQPITDLDPYNAATAVDEACLIARRLIFDTLVRHDGEKLVPGLATSWRRTDANTWVFDLRPGVRFHDGRPLTARDVVACLEHTRSVPSVQSPLWEPVVSARAIDEHTVAFTTDGPLASLPVNLTLLFVAPERLVADPAQSRSPIGSGAFRVEEFTPSTSVELSRFDGYWRGGAKLPAISMPFIAENSSAITALLGGDIDLLWPIPPDQLAEVSGAADVTVDRVPSWTYYFMWFNCAREPFTDPRVRRAMWLAIDVEQIVRELFGGGAERMRAPIPSSVFGAADQAAYDHDPDAARRLLREAGLGGGFETSMMWFDATGPLARELAQSMISAWSDIGVTVNPESLEKAQWLERLNNLEWTMNLQTNTVTTGDAAFTFDRLYTSEADRMGYRNAELDRIIAAAGRESDTRRRAELYARVCRILWDDAVGIFPATLVTAYAGRREITGFEPVPSNQPDLSTVRRR